MRCRRSGILPGMYAPFFGLQHAPFSIAPDPRYLFMSESHREALAHLLYGVKGGGLVNDIFTVAKVAAVMLLVGAGPL